MARIFISYRRSDSAHAAANLTDKLQQHFGQDSIFFDVDNIPLGVDFREHIGNAVGQCDVLLVIIGEKWAQLVDEQGNRRLNQPSDYVRIEIESALKRNIPVIPVLTGEAEMPTANDLPPSIQSIAFRNAAELSAGRDRHQHVARLIQGLEEIVSRKSLPEGKATSGNAPHDKGAVQDTAAKVKPRASKVRAKATPDKEPVHDAEPPMIANKNDNASELLENIQKVLQGFTNNNLFVWGLIPPDKLNNAIKAYAPQVSPEDVLLLYDNTAFGGAKQGLLLTADTVYWNILGQQPGHFLYTHIHQVSSCKRVAGAFAMLYGMPTKLLINYKEIFINRGGDTDKIAESLANVISYLISR